MSEWSGEEDRQPTFHQYCLSLADTVLTADPRRIEDPGKLAGQIAGLVRGILLQDPPLGIRGEEG